MKLFKILKSANISINKLLIIYKALDVFKTFLYKYRYK